MLATEAEAKKKRCTPALVIQLLPIEQLNGLAVRGENLGASNCIGSACMQWAWYDYANANGQTWHQLARAGTLPGFAKGKREAGEGSGWNQFPARGFCGLTGTRE